MERVIVDKIHRLELELKTQSGVDRKVTQGKIDVLYEILKTDDRKFKIAMLKDNQRNWDMGLIDRKTYEDTIKQIGGMKG